MGTTIAVASGKGGVGKTTLAVNLGYMIADAGAKVLLLDLNFGLRNIDIYLGLENRSVFDLGDVVSGVCRVEKAIVQHDLNSNLYLLTCPQYKEITGFTAAHLQMLCASLKKEFDYIILDVPTGVGEMLSCAAAAADMALVVITPDYVSIRNGDTVDQKLENLGVEKRFYAVNRVTQTEDEDSELPGSEYISRTFGTPLAGIVPEDEAVNLANNSGVPVCSETGSYISRNFARIAARLIK